LTVKKPVKSSQTDIFVFLEHKPAAARLTWIPQQAKSNSIPTGC